MNYKEHQAQLKQYKEYEVLQNTPTTESAKRFFLHKPYDHIRGTQNGNKEENTNK